MSTPGIPPDAAVGLTVIDAAGTVHARSWQVPPRQAERFAMQMSAWFGEPDEMVTDVATMVAGGQQAAAVIMLAGEEDGHG